MKRSLFIGLIFSLLLNVKGQVNCPCELLVKDGLYKTFDITNIENFEKDFKSYLEKSTFKKDFKEKKWNFGIDVIVDEIPIGLKSGATDDEINTFQNKIKSGNSLKITDDFYFKSSLSIPDVEFAKVYTDCVSKNCGFGFSIDVNASEKDVFFLINYKRLSGTDPMPIVKDFIIKGALNVNTSLKIGENLLEQNTVSCDRIPQQDMIILLTTDKGIVPYRVPSLPSGFNKDLPVGTIITSYLTWEEFQIVTKNNTNNPDGNIWNSKYSKWAPCDGRPVNNESGFYRATTLTTLPDLRGVFLRGYNKFDNNESSRGINPVSIDQKDPEDNRIRGKIQKDAFQKHTHGTRKVPPQGSGAAGTDKGLATSNKFTNDYPLGDDAPNYPKIGYSGDIESRPKNIAVYYYIRIN